MSRHHPMFVTAAVVACSLLTLGSVPAHAAPTPLPAQGEPEFHQQVIFTPHDGQGYACYRIPAVVKAADGSLLAFAEGRVNDCSDAGDIDVVEKRSTDGGVTWSPLRVVNSGDGDTHGNPVPIVDRQTGRVVLITTYNTGTGGNCPSPCLRTVHEQHSDDNGLTWSVPVSIDTQVRRPAWNSWYASGPQHGIQLRHGEHAGRLAFGFNAESADPAHVNFAGLAYSDDHGVTWQLGAVDSFPVTDGVFTQKPSELSETELADGDLYVQGREQGGTDVGNRDFAISADGGQTFRTHFTTIPDFVAPMVQGSVLRLDRPGPERLIASTPSDTDRRRWMMVRSSFDHGRTWQSADDGALVTRDWSGYSDLVQISGHDDPTTWIGLMYEGGKVDARDEIRFARFDEAWLGWNHHSGTRAKDSSPLHADAVVQGAARLVDGVDGPGLAFDGPGDFIRVPYAPARLPGAGGFTWSAWVNYGASTSGQALLWLGGMGRSAPQLWFRAEPGKHRLIAFVTTRPGSAPARSGWVASDSAYNDQRWHHITLVKRADSLAIWVDGQQAASGPMPVGSISQTVAFQYVIGRRLDGANEFHGTMDEVKSWTRALGPDEIRQLYATGSASDRDLVLRLSFTHENQSPPAPTV